MIAQDDDDVSIAPVDIQDFATIVEGNRPLSVTAEDFQGFDSQRDRTVTAGGVKYFAAIAKDNDFFHDRRICPRFSVLAVYDDNVSVPQHMS